MYIRTDYSYMAESGCINIGYLCSECMNPKKTDSHLRGLNRQHFELSRRRDLIAREVFGLSHNAEVLTLGVSSVYRLIPKTQ